MSKLETTNNIEKKAAFTVSQIVFTVLSIFLYLFAIVSDIFVMYLEHFNKKTYGGFFIKLNLIISAAALIVSLFLIFRTGRLNPFSKANPGGNVTEGIKVLRTYICMISFDISVTLCLMPAGLAGFKSAKIAVLIFTPAFFIVSAVMYFVRAGKLGFDDFDKTDDIDDNDDFENFDDNNF